MQRERYRRRRRGLSHSRPMKPLLLLLVIIAPLWVFSQNETPKAVPVEKARLNQVVDYEVLEGDRSAELSRKVKDALKRGWEPFGALNVIKMPSDGVEHRFYQAVIKRGN